jgi:DNA-binding protein HU-beta
VVALALLWADLLETAPAPSGIEGGYKVNKNTLVAEIAKRSGMSKTDVGRAVDATFDVITDALKQNEDVRLVGFGTFSVSERSATEGRNPRTGEAIHIPASKRGKFKPGKALNSALN